MNNNIKLTKETESLLRIISDILANRQIIRKHKCDSLDVNFEYNIILEKEIYLCIHFNINSDKIYINTTDEKITAEHNLCIKNVDENNDLVIDKIIELLLSINSIKIIN